MQDATTFCLLLLSLLSGGAALWLYSLLNREREEGALARMDARRFEEEKKALQGSLEDAARQLSDLLAERDAIRRRKSPSAH